MAVTSVLLTGVGGQGIITAGQVLAGAALAAGHDVKKSEVHGMSQRGGSVESHVRWSADGAVSSPLIPAGQADFLVALELLEGLRVVHQVSTCGAVIASRRMIPPLAVQAGEQRYPEDPLGLLREHGAEVIAIEADAIAADVGNPRAANLVLLGALAARVDLPEQAWQDAIEDAVPVRGLASSREAFRRGRELASEGGY